MSILGATNAVLFGYPSLQVAWAVFGTAWVLQFIGHGVFEGRAPALFDSLAQALLTAPMFVLLEVAFFLGYRRGFYKRMMVQVEKNIKEYKKSKAN